MIISNVKKKWRIKEIILQNYINLDKNSDVKITNIGAP